MTQSEHAHAAKATGSGRPRASLARLAAETGRIIRHHTTKLYRKLSGRAAPPARAAYRASITHEEVMALPLLSYDGPIHLINRDEDVPAAVAALRRARVLGFDTESRPSFRRGEHHPVALLQLADGKAVYIFQLLHLRRHDWFVSLFNDPHIVKTGVSIRDDLRRLHEWSTFETRGFVDLAHLSDRAGIRENGLRGLAAVILGGRISKGARRTNWAVPRLSPAQLQYAATDAWVGRELFLKLESYARMPESEFRMPAESRPRHAHPRERRHGTGGGLSGHQSGLPSQQSQQTTQETGI